MHRPAQPGRNCYTCQYFGGVWSRTYVRCDHSGNVGTYPNQGCAFWTREPGSDDEPLRSDMPEVQAADRARFTRD